MIEKGEPPDAGGVGEILRRVLANAGMLLGGRTINAILGLAYMAVVARALGVSEMGVLVLIHAFALFLGEVVKFQSWQTVLQYGARPLAAGDTPRFQQVLRFTLALDIASTLLGMALGVIGAFAFSGSLGWGADAAPAAALYMLSLVFMVSATPIGLLRLFDRFDVMANQAALVSLVRLIGSGVAWWLHGGLESFLAAWALGSVVAYAYLLAAAWRELHTRRLLEGFAWNGPFTQGLPGIWRFAWNTNLAATLEVALTHVVTLVVGMMVGPGAAAFWRIGRQIADAIAKPAKLLVPALYPELARLRVEERHDDMWRLVKRVGVLAGGVGLLVLLVAVLAGGPLLTLVMGEAFAPAASVMTWQVAAAVVAIFALPLEPMLVSLGKPGAAVRVHLAVGVTFLISLPFLIEAFGLTGAGAGLVGAATALALGMLWFILRMSGNRRARDRSAGGGDGLKGDV